MPDHDPLDAGNLLDPIQADLPIVVTKKDWVKLRRRNDVGDRQIWIAQDELRIEPAEDFRRWLLEALQAAH
jgi:hypothetical protein